jgi:retron-type reverse transcriptase
MVYPGMSTKWILRVEPVGIVTAGLPKYRKIYGNGGLILAARLSKRSYTTRVMSRECEVVQHNNLTSFNLVTGRCKSNYSTNTNINRRKIYSEIRDPHALTYSYEQISKNKGSNSKGINGETLDSYSKDTILSLAKSLKDHSFKFKPIRRVLIPKKDGTLRPLGIPSPRDKVVTKSISLSLEKIYENIFLNSSHGFRPGRGTHSAIKTVTR